LDRTFQLRSGQRAFESDLLHHRIAAFLTRRQYGKTTLAAFLALKRMMLYPGHTVIFGSVKLDLGREVVRKESELLRHLLPHLAALAQTRNHQFLVADAKTGRILPADLSAADFAQLYEARRLEFRLHFTDAQYSRTKVVALTPETVGETGDLITDEVGRARRFRETCEAAKPIISSNPAYRWILTTTPPPDDTHYSFELLAPPPGWDPPPNPAGNTYQSPSGIFVRRVTAYDAELDHVPLFDDRTGEFITPAEARAREDDKTAWDRNYAVKFVLGGTAAVALNFLDTARQRGREADSCEFFLIEDDPGLDHALAWLRPRLTAGMIGLGWDIATTERQTSNPSALALVEKAGPDYLARLILVWKTANQELALQRVRSVIELVHTRPRGGRARRLCLDATNERYYFGQVRTTLTPLIPVEGVIASAAAPNPRPGQPPLTLKQLLGERLIAALENNRLALPAARYIHEDFRLVRKERGHFTCDPDSQGRHGDTFDAVKLALHALAPTAVTDVTPMAILGEKWELGARG